MSRAFFLSLRSFVRREVIRVLPLALLLRLGYEITGAGGSRTFLGRFWGWWFSFWERGSVRCVKGGEKVYHCGVAVQDKCPFKWLAEMSLGYAAMVSDEDVVGPAQGRRVGGPSASRYFLTVALWIPNSRSIARSDIPLRLAF